jgi:Tfp pilus assembly protein PilX
MSIIKPNSKTKLRQSQEGVVSLLVTMVLMIVVSLIALGFAQVARRNQGQQLDQQLSTQAFYAAESGVNDAAQIVTTELNAPNNVPANNLSRTTCTAGGYNNVYLPLNTHAALGTNAENVSYTCVLINPTPGAIQTDISTTSKIIPVNATSNITGINLMWSTKKTTTTPANSCPTSVKLPTATAWGNCGMGVLRVDLVPVDNSAPTNATTLAKEALTFFVVPMAPGGAGSTNTVTYGGASSSTSNTNNIVGVDCQNTGPNCTVKINTAGYTHQAYDMRVSSEYEDSALEVTATGATGALPLSGAQVVIDATGKAQNVVRRIQVYVPIGVESNQLSDYAIESTDSICKRYVVMTGYYANEIGALGINANNPTLDPLCQ